MSKFSSDSKPINQLFHSTIVLSIEIDIEVNSFCQNDEQFLIKPENGIKTVKMFKCRQFRFDCLRK